MAGLRFRSWEASLSDGSKKRGGLPRASGILDAVRAVVAECGRDAVIRVELETNYGKAHVQEKVEFLQLVDRHLQPTVSMTQTMERKKTRTYRRSTALVSSTASKD